MKAERTDNYHLFPWAMLLVAVYFGWQAISVFHAEDGSRLGIYLGGAVVFLLLALRKFWETRASIHTPSSRPTQNFILTGSATDTPRALPVEPPEGLSINGSPVEELSHQGSPTSTSEKND